MVWNSLLFLMLLSNLWVKLEAAKILAVFPVPVISHQMVFRVLMEELVRRGHHITVITPIPYATGQAPVNYTEIDVSDFSFNIKDKLLTEDTDISQDLYTQFTNIFKVTTDLLDGMLSNRHVQNLIQDKTAHFDLIFLEDCFKPVLIFSHIFKAPVIQISSFGGTFESFETVGAATHALLYPLAVRERYYNLSLWEKISEMIFHYRTQKAFIERESIDDEIIRKHLGTRCPTINELKKNVHMLFLNLHPIWDSNRPVPTNVVYLGGFHRKPQDKLPKDLKLSLDSSTNGVIYVSFGTNVNPHLLSEEIMQIFVNVFSKLPYDIYIKWNKKLPTLSENIKVMDWYPQADLLMHPNVKLFITQGGLQSTDEAIAGGVPLLGIPLLWDQWYNVEKYVQLEIGLQLDINTITETKLKDTIEKLMEDSRYKDNIVKLHSVMLDQAQTPLERAVWWTEYVIRHGGANHLRAPSANMTWIEYYEVKLILYIIMTIIFILVVIFKILCMLSLLGKKIKND